MKSQKWISGQPPAPKNWRDAADAIRNRQKPKRKPSGLMEKLAAIEQQLKERQ